jgi:hypothetical protein
MLKERYNHQYGKKMIDNKNIEEVIPQTVIGINDGVFKDCTEITFFHTDSPKPFLFVYWGLYTFSGT